MEAIAIAIINWTAGTDIAYATPADGSAAQTASATHSLTVTSTQDDIDLSLPIVIT